MNAFSARRLVETPSLSDQVRNYLLEELTSGRMCPGARINEAALARTLGISRNPIREAISGLAQRGYLVAAPRRGHSMRLFTLHDVNDVFSFRTCVESFALRQAVPRMRKPDHARLRRIADGMHTAALAGKVTQVRQGDIAFHRTICELSGNRQTLRAHEGIDMEMQMLIASVDLGRESLLETAMIHLPILDAIERQDVERSVAVMEQHIKSTWDDVLKIYEDAGQKSAKARTGASARPSRNAGARPAEHPNRAEGTT